MGTFRIIVSITIRKYEGKKQRSPSILKRINNKAHNLIADIPQKKAPDTGASVTVAFWGPVS